MNDDVAADRWTAHFTRRRVVQLLAAANGKPVAEMEALLAGMLEAHWLELYRFVVFVAEDAVSHER